MPILLGFEILTGRRFEVPTKGHLAWFGQTQLSGKTTALEALVYRADFKAVAFITKRGEGSFLTGRMIPPYFSEPTNDPEQPLWRWVMAILEASQQRTMRIEEHCVIDACEKPSHAESLREVHANVKALLAGEKKISYKRGKTLEKWLRKPVGGLDKSLFTSLNAYFNILMPQLERMPYTKALNLKTGLNVMDLREYSREAQGMVIRSVMEYVYSHERNTRVIVPEAQDFVPQGKNSPVKMACETIVRKGGADGNFMWLDSQDMAAVDKIMLRAVSILGVGVQGEAHEMARSIAHLFGATTKLTPRDIGSLKIGEFYVRLAGGDVSKVYVQPCWMSSEIHARAIAMGEETVDSARQILKKFKKEMVNDAESQAPEPIETPKPQEKEAEYHCDTIREGVQHSSAENIHDEQSDDDHGTGVLQEGSSSLAGSDSGRVPDDGDDQMYKEKYEALQTEHKTLIQAHDALAARIRLIESHIGPDGLKTVSVLENAAKSSQSSAPAPVATDRVSEGGNGAGNGAVTPKLASDYQLAEKGLEKLSGSLLADELDNLYLHVKVRALRDPGILELLASRPELRVTVPRYRIEMNTDSMQGRMAYLISQDFFLKPTPTDIVMRECVRRGWLGNKTPRNLLDKKQALGGLVELGFLTKESTGYQSVPGMKINIVETK